MHESVILYNKTNTVSHSSSKYTVTFAWEH